MPPDPAEIFAQIAQPGDIVAIVGAGGKTTTMLALAQALAARGLRVVTTKSTRIHKPTMARSPFVWEGPRDTWAQDLPALLRDHPVITVVQNIGAEHGWDGIAPEQATELRDVSGADVLIVEADGARGRMLKAPDAHEPSMPSEATVVMPVASLQAVGRTLDARTVHRPEVAAEILHIPEGTIIEPALIAMLLASPLAGMKSVPPGARVWPVITRTDLPPRGAAGLTIVPTLREIPRAQGWAWAEAVEGEWHYGAEAFE